MPQLGGVVPHSTYKIRASLCKNGVLWSVFAPQGEAKKRDTRIGRRVELRQRAVHVKEVDDLLCIFLSGLSHVVVANLAASPSRANSAHDRRVAVGWVEVVSVDTTLAIRVANATVV